MGAKRAVLILLACAALACLGGCREKKPPPKAPATATAPAGAADSLPATLTEAIDDAHLAKAQRAINNGLGFLLSKQNADGGWGFEPGASHPALTAMAVKALLRHPQYTPASQPVSKALSCLIKFRQGDGGFYLPGRGNKNYITSVAVMALVEAGPEYRQPLADAVKFLRGLQIVAGSKVPDGDEIGEKHPWTGGVSYGDHGRPDLSNEGMWMEALHEAGVPGDDPAMQRALAFVKRLQNRTEGTEGQVFVIRGADDGGFAYAIGRKDGEFVAESKAGSDDRGLRSYGSMTYTGFKSMLYANVGRKDPRVRAAFDWIREYWRLDANPNMPQLRSRQGLFYYYHVFAKALRAWGQDVIPDKRGVKHNWRQELIDVLADMQAGDGSWVNADEERWFEGNPVLATCYAVLALEETLRQ